MSLLTAHWLEMSSTVTITENETTQTTSATHADKGSEQTGNVRKLTLFRDVPHAADNRRLHETRYRTETADSQKKTDYAAYVERRSAEDWRSTHVTLDEMPFPPRRFVMSLAAQRLIYRIQVHILLFFFFILFFFHKK